VKSFQSVEDAQNVKSALAGDRAACDSLIRDHFGVVYAISLARMNYNHDAAEDLAQETFLRAYLNLQKLKHPELFGAWILQITRNIALDWHRKNQRRSNLVQIVSLDNSGSIELAGAESSPYEKAVQAEEHEKLYQALNQLPQAHRELIHLHYIEGYSQSEIARRLGKHPSSVMRQLRQSINQFEKLYLKKSSDSYQHAKSLRAKSLTRTLTLISGVAGLPALQRTSLASLTADGAIIPTSNLDSNLFSVLPSGGLIMKVASVIFGVAIITITLYRGGPNESFGRSDIINTQSPGSSRIEPSIKATRKHNNSTALLSSNQSSENESSNESIETPVHLTSSAPCHNWEEVSNAIGALQSRLAQVQYSFIKEDTLGGAKPNETQVRETEGTVTISGKACHIELRSTNNGNPESPVESLTTLGNDRVRVVRYPFMKAEVLPTERVETALRHHNPLRSIMESVYPNSIDESFYDFLEAEIKESNIQSTCTRSRSGTAVLSFGSDSWTAVTNIDRIAFPYYLKILTGPEGGIKRDREILEVATYQDLTYPRKFVRRTYGYDTVGTYKVVSASTATVTILKLGNEVRGIPVFEPTEESQTTSMPPAAKSPEQARREQNHRNRIEEAMNKTRPLDQRTTTPVSIKEQESL